MKKKLLIIVAIMLSIVLFSTALLSILHSKKEVRPDKFTNVQIENNPFNFGTITKNDTIKHIFKITNRTQTPFVIERVAPSCTCTVSRTDKKICRFNETASIEAFFTPKPKQKGKVKTTVFVQCNAEKGVIKLELIGNIK